MNPDMWTELVFDNKEYVLPELTAFIERMVEFKAALENKNEDVIKSMFAKGNTRKEQIDKGKK